MINLQGNTIIDRLFRVYLYGSIHISLIGFFAYDLINRHFQDGIISSIIFGLLIFIYYNLSRILRIYNYDSIQNNTHLVWVSKNLTELIFALIASFIFIIVLADKIKFFELFPIYTIVLSCFYFVLREIKCVKNLIISFVWTSLFFNREDSISHFQEGVFIFSSLFIISIWYDQKDELKNKHKEFFYLFWVDLSVLIPFLIIKIYC